jgi:hypothetical protein
MSHAFATIPAKPTFGTLNEKISQGDFINRKKSKNMYCMNSKLCGKMKNVNSYDTLNSFNLGLRLKIPNIGYVNKYNLITAQYSKLNLNGVCTVSKGAPPTTHCSSETPCNPCQNNDAVIIDTSTTSVPFYLGQTIDPLGELFGRTQCGELNYVKYMSI